MDLNLNDSIVSSLINTKNDKTNKVVAKKLIDNIISPFPGLGDIKFNNTFSWDYKHKKQSNSFQIYLQGMRMINMTLNHFYVDSNDVYLYKSQEIFDDWMDYIEEGNSNNMTWYDHTIASRSMALMKLIYFCSKSGVAFDEERYFKYLKIHADKLMDDTIHRKNNHGLMIDRALMSIGFLTNNKEYFLKGYERAKTIFWLMYSENGVHLENSPEYHNMVYNMYVQIEEYLSENDESLGSEVVEKFEVINRYRGIILKPDNKFPPIGDSSHSENKSDIKMLWEDFHDPASGISVVKNKDNLFYLVFICGFSTITHKHSDDLSFILNYNTKDFFVDPGKYRYSNDRFRRYIVSRRAHTSFSTDRVPIKKENSNRYNKKVHTDHFLTTKTYTLISGYLKGRDGLFLRRTLYYLHHENILVGFDYGSSPNEELWSERFNLSQDVKVNLLADNQYELTNSDVNIYLSFLKNYENKIVNAKIKSKWPKAFNSPANGKIINTKQILNNKSDSSNFDNGFIVVMGKNKKVNIVKDEEEYELRVNNRIYHLPIVAE